MNKYSVVSLSDVTDIISGFAFKGNDFGSIGEIVIKIKDISPPIIDIRTAQRVRFDKFSIKKMERYKISKGDFVVAMTGATIGKMGILLSDHEAYVNQRVAIIRPSENVDKSFIYYSLLTERFQKHIKNNIDSQSAQENISSTSIGRFSIFLPSLKEQKNISKILSSLDQKIEINRQINETLEEMARAIFKDWFVDFGPTHRKAAGETDPVAILGGLIADPKKAANTAALFPDSFDGNGLPEGWVENGLNEIAEFLNGLALQKYPAEKNADSLPVIKIAELRNGITAKSGRASSNLPEKYIVKDGDFIFSWSGSLMAKFWTEGEGALNQHLFKVSSNVWPNWFYAGWVFYHLKEFKQIAASKATTMGHIQRAHLSAAKVICPPIRIVKKMSTVMGKLLSLTIQNQIQDQTLAATRDLLLPKLMSGELCLKDMEDVI